ncbi:hypothetical protein OIO90_001005 [Microbotryomycetes sp. JL221]|nr:hypothetical protein OIO90_001005 [Microbotryomycetes sp. JL221]
MAKTPNGQRLAPLFTQAILPPLALSTTFLSFVPRGVLTRIVTMLSGQTESLEGARTTTALVTSPGTVVSALAMAAEEMRQVTELDAECLQTYGDRMYWYWAKGDDDHWVNDSSVQEIERVLDEAGHQRSGRRRRCDQGMKHAFVLRDDHANALASMISAWMLEARQSTL